MPISKTNSGTTPVHNRKIALFSAYYPEHGGGMELACADLADAFLSAGMQVEWVSQANGDEFAYGGVSYMPFAGTDVVYAVSGVPVPIPMPWSVPAIARATARADAVVIVEANFIVSIIAFLAAKWHRKPILLVQHVGQPSTVSKLARIAMSFGEMLAVCPMVRRANAVVYVSPVVAQHFDGVRTKSASMIIGHGINISRFRLPRNQRERAHDRKSLGLSDKGRLACFVGRLTESKGISVFAEMARLRPEWTFAVAGTGPIEPAAWGQPNLIPLGQLDRDDIAKLFRAGDVMVLPSPSESFSLVVREALASGTSVLCADQILDTDPGLAPFLTTETVNLSDIAATAARFAAALDRLPEIPKTAAHDYVASQCSQTATNARYVQLIENLLLQQSRADL